MEIVVNIRSRYQVFCLFNFCIKNLLQLRSQIQTLSNNLIYYKSVKTPYKNNNLNQFESDLYDMVQIIEF